jgi:hypothetical protein
MTAASRAAADQSWLGQRFGTRTVMSKFALRTFAFVFAMAMVLPIATHAAPTGQVAYTKEQVYSASLRFLRIELRYDITEKDPDAAYLLFEYHPLGQKALRFGAIEIVPQASGVRLIVRLPDQPSYQETVLRDGLVRKLEADYGIATLPPTKPEPPARTPSEDKDTAKGSGRPNDRSPADSGPSE